MTKSWRPEGWEVPEWLRWNDGSPRNLYEDEKLFYELGADAMLEELLKEQARGLGIRQAYYCNGKLSFRELK